MSDGTLDYYRNSSRAGQILLADTKCSRVDGLVGRKFTVRVSGKSLLKEFDFSFENDEKAEEWRLGIEKVEREYMMRL